MEFNEFIDFKIILCYSQHFFWEGERILYDRIFYAKYILF